MRHAAAQPPPDGLARRAGHRRRAPRQSRHGHARARRRLSAARGRRLHPVRERRDRRRPGGVAGAGRPRSRRCQQPPHHAAPGRVDRRLRLVVRHDPRRAYRRHHPRRLRGGGQRRPRQLGHARAQQGAAGRRRDGPGRRRARGVGHHGAQHAQGRAAAGRGLHAAAHRQGLREARLHRPCGGRGHARRVRGARDAGGHDEGAADAHRARCVCAGLRPLVAPPLPDTE